MYNRYINSDGFDLTPPDSSSPPDREAAAAPEPPPFSAETSPEENKPKGLGALKNLLGSNIKLPELNADTLLLLVLVYFLVADPEDGKISDTVLIIAALFLLGL